MLILFVVTLVAGLSAHGAPGGGGGGAAPAGGGAAPAGGAGQPNRVVPPPPNLAPGQQRPDRFPPPVVDPNAKVNPNAQVQVGVSNQFGVATNQFSLTASNQFNAGISNQFAGNTNQFGSNTNQFGNQSNQFARDGSNSWGMWSNRFAARPGPGTTNWGGRSTNYSPLSPASRSGGTNRYYGGTNSVGGTNQSGAATGNQTSVSSQTSVNFQDRGFSATDQALIARLRQSVMPRAGAPSLWAPVHFNVQDGRVTLVGSVPSVEEEQRIMAMAQSTPGVVGVNSQLTISPDSNTGISAANQSSIPATNLGGLLTTNLAPTSERANFLNRVYSATNGPSVPINYNPFVAPGASQ